MERQMVTCVGLTLVVRHQKKKRTKRGGVIGRVGMVGGGGGLPIDKFE
jgi:hypothetical protein